MLLNFLTSRSGTDPCARFRKARADSSNTRSLPNVVFFADKSLVSAGIPPASQKDPLVSAEQTVWETAAQAWIRVDQQYTCTRNQRRGKRGWRENGKKRKKLPPPRLLTFSSMLSDVDPFKSLTSTGMPPHFTTSARDLGCFSAKFARLAAACSTAPNSTSLFSFENMPVFWNKAIEVAGLSPATS